MKKKVGLALLLALVFIPVNSYAASCSVYISKWMRHTNKTIALEEGWLYEYTKINPDATINTINAISVITDEAVMSRIANSDYYIDSGALKIFLSEPVKSGASFKISIENAVWAFASADSTLKTPKQTVSGVIQTSVTLPQAVKAGKAGVALKEPYTIPNGNGDKPLIVGNGVALESGTYLAEKSVVPEGWRVYVGTTGALQPYVGKILSTEFVVPDKQSVILGGGQKIPTGMEFKLAPGSVIAKGSVFLEGATVPKGAVIAEGSEIDGSITVSKPDQLRTAVETFKEGEFYRLNEKAFKEFGVNIEASDYMKPDVAVPESKIVREAGKWERTDLLPSTTYNVENGIFIPSDKKDGSGTYYRYQNNIAFITGNLLNNYGYSGAFNEISYAFSLSQKDATEGIITILEDGQAGRMINIPIVIRTNSVGKSYESPVISVTSIWPIGGIEIGVNKFLLAVSGDIQNR